MEAKRTVLEEETPYLSICAYKKSQNKKLQFISYDSVSHQSTNIKEGGLDTCTGKFLFGLSGTYSVSWNYFLESRSPYSDVFLIRNEKKGDSIPETKGTWSLQEGSLQGRSVFVDMKKGETLGLFFQDYSNNDNSGVDRITFCISLVHAHTIDGCCNICPEIEFWLAVIYKKCTILLLCNQQTTKSS